MDYSKPSLNWWIEPLAPVGLWFKIAVIAVISVFIESQPTQPNWAISMILIAAFILVPIGFQQIIKRNVFFRAQFNAYTESLPQNLGGGHPDTLRTLQTHFVCSCLLALSFSLEKSLLAGLFAIPYAFWCAYVFLKILKFDIQLPYLTILAAWGFLTNAAFWCVFDRFNCQPLGFTPWIVLLTGVHFHYAGYALTLSLALLLSENPHYKIAKIAAWGVLSGVVLTAMGITTTQLGFSPFIETLAGVWMAISAFLVGLAFVQKGFFDKKVHVVELYSVRLLWATGGMCLMLGMTLAFLYALRHILPIAELTIPNMQAWHGTLNALGFGTLMLLGWALKRPL